jgi:hypothetical protein
VVASGASRRQARCTIVDRMGPDPSGEWDATQDAPRIYRPVSPLTDYTEIIGHWHAHVAYRSEPGNRWKRWAHPAIPADVPGAPRGYFVEAIKA